MKTIQLNPAQFKILINMDCKILQDDMIQKTAIKTWKKEEAFFSCGEDTAPISLSSSSYARFVELKNNGLFLKR